MKMTHSGGTGRHSGLKILWPEGRGGSSPLYETYAPIAQLDRATDF